MWYRDINMAEDIYSPDPMMIQEGDDEMRKLARLL